MTEPAKDEAELIAQITDTLSSGIGLGFTFSNAIASRCFYYDQAIRALAAIRAAGWAVVPVAEQDALRAENTRLRDALLDAQGPMYVEFVRHLPVFRCEEEP